jgi:hypothetical protein
MKSNVGQPIFSPLLCTGHRRRLPYLEFGMAVVDEDVDGLEL